MSTRSYICYELNSFITFKYNHFDGYVHDGVGQTLVEDYNSFELAQAVTDIGDGRALCSTLEETKAELLQ